MLLAVAASAVALALGMLAPQILTIIYGSTLGAAGLFRILLIALPIDFCFSLLWTVLVSRGYQRPVLYSLGVVAAVNVSANLWFIPRFQAKAAACGDGWRLRAVVLLLLAYVLRTRIFARAPEGGEVTSAVWA